jgi:hypothetical protein
MVHPVLATRPHLGCGTIIEGRGEPGRLSRVMSPWYAQWKGVGWATVGFTGWRVGEEPRPGLGHAKIKKKEGKKWVAGSGSASSWVSAHCQIGIRNSFSFSNLFIICKLI